MKSLRFYLILLVVLLTLFFNVERLDLMEENVLNVQTFSYGLVVFIVLAHLFIPQLSRYPVVWVVIGWLAVYLSLKLTLFNQRPLFEGINIYVTITEAAFIASITAVVYTLAKELKKFESGVETITLMMADEDFQDTETATAHVHSEMTRSRHYNRPLSVITINPDDSDMVLLTNQAINQIQMDTATRYLRAKAIHQMRQQLRPMDSIYFDRKVNAFVVVCPEVNEEGATAVAAQLNRVLSDMNISAEFRSASFPNEGLTFAGLLEAAQQKALSE